MSLITQNKTANILVIAAFLGLSAMNSFAAKTVGNGTGGAANGGGSSSPPPSLTLPATSDVYTGVSMFLSVRATSSTSDLPVITFNHGPTGMTVIGQGSYPRKYGFQPYSYYTVQWTPDRGQIGIQTASFTATTRSGSTTSTVTLTVHDAPSALTGLTATETAPNAITLSWDATTGGVKPISHAVTACYLIPAPPAVVITRSTQRGPSHICELVDTTTANQAIISSYSQPNSVDGISYPYNDVTVSVVAADGIAAPSGTAIVQRAP
jgi:hypothetical protein